MGAEGDEVRDAAAYLRARLDQGELDHMPPTAFGRRYAPLRFAAVVRSALSDWQDSLADRGAGRPPIIPDDPDHDTLKCEIIDLFGRVYELGVGGIDWPRGGPSTCQGATRTSRAAASGAQPSRPDRPDGTITMWRRGTTGWSPRPARSRRRSPPVLIPR